MDINDKNQETVTRELEWNVGCMDNYLLSEIFEVFFDNNQTKWQIILHRDVRKVYALLKMIQSSTNDYVVDFTINKCENKDRVSVKYDAKYFYEHWLYILTGDPKTPFALQIKISLTKKEPENVIKCGLNYVIKNYGRFLISEKFSDLTLICSDNVEYPVHKFVLLANSPDMLIRMSNNKFNCKCVVKDIDGETMLQVLSFLYTGEVKDVLKLESKLLSCAESYDLDVLKKQVVELMIKCISVNNVLVYYELADEYHEDKLMEKCLLFIQKNYQAVQASDYWDHFDSRAKALLKISFLRDGYKDPIYVLKTLKTFYHHTLPAEYKKFP